MLIAEDYESALIIFREISNLYPLNIEYIWAIWKIYYNLWDFKKAFPYLEKYYLRKNFSKDFIVEYAYTIIKLHKFEKINSVLKKMEKLKIDKKIINKIKNNLESLWVKF
jgi:tetratricopeptide (TPR) repeat protein